MRRIVEEGLSDDDREVFGEWLAEELSVSKLHRRLKADGHPVAHSTLSRHLFGYCGCEVTEGAFWGAYRDSA